jgi:hypothetical protein
MYRSISRLTLAAFAAAALLAAAGCGSATADNLDREQIAAVTTGYLNPPLVCDEIVVTAERPDWILDEVVSVAEKPALTPKEDNVRSPWPYDTEVAAGHTLSPSAAN